MVVDIGVVVYVEFMDESLRELSISFSFYARVGILMMVRTFNFLSCSQYGIAGQAKRVAQSRLVSGADIAALKLQPLIMGDVKITILALPNDSGEPATFERCETLIWYIGISIVTGGGGLYTRTNLPAGVYRHAARQKGSDAGFPAELGLARVTL